MKPWTPADGARVQLRMLPVLEKLIKAGAAAGLDAERWEIHHHTLHLTIGPSGVSVIEARRRFMAWCAVVGVPIESVRERTSNYDGKARLVGAVKIGRVEVVVVAEAYIEDLDTTPEGQ